MPKTEKPKTVIDYINSAPKEAQGKLRELRSCLRKVASKAEEGLRYGVPAFSFKKILFLYAGFKNHIGFYPTPSAIKAFEKDLAEYKTAKGTIQFPLDKPLPLSLIRRIAAFRIREVKEKCTEWQ